MERTKCFERTLIGFTAARFIMRTIGTDAQFAGVIVQQAEAFDHASSPLAESFA